MKIENLIKNRSKIILILALIILGFLSLQVPVNTLAGSGVKFTLFDLFAPISGAFLGTVWGVTAVLAMQLVNLLAAGLGSVDKGAIIRLLPTLFGVVYFSLAAKSNVGKKLLIVPALAIVSFNLNDVGRSVWYYSLFWLIPIAVWPLRQRFLVLRSLGATFYTHSVGGAIWIWAFNLPEGVWKGLIPVVITERIIFALGISASYILMNNLLAYLNSKKFLPAGVSFSKKYLFK